MKSENDCARIQFCLSPRQPNELIVCPTDGLKDWGQVRLIRRLPPKEFTLTSANMHSLRFQNLNMGVKFLYDDMNDKKCGVRKGYWKAVRGREWFSTDDYFDEFDKSLETCLAGCPECRLVLTGHSQVS